MSDGQPCGKNCKKEKNKCLPCITPNPQNIQDLQDQKPHDGGSCECEKKPCCKADDPQAKIQYRNKSNMTHPNNKIDIKSCAKVEKIHPCDPPLPCDPNFEEDDCPTPYICQERLKNPQYPGEVTRCRSGGFMHVKACAKVEPPHACELQPCSAVAEVRKKPPCQEPPLCLQRIKNPEMKKKLEPCDPNKFN